MNLSGSSQQYRLQQMRLGLSSEQIDKNLSIIAENARIEMLDILEDIKQYGVWNYELIEDCNSEVPLIYKYPNGKYGDIDDFIANAIAKPIKISALEYQINVIPRESYKEIELLVGYYKQGFCLNKVKQFDEDYNREALDMLISINRVWALINQYYTWRWASSRIDFYDEEIYNLIHGRYLYMKRTRNEIYNKAILKKKPSSKWSSEIIAYTIVHHHYNDAVFQYQPDWLGRQSLDIYIPSRAVAIEYQGIQHFAPVALFDGVDGLEHRMERDKLKKNLCQENGVRLLEWMYDDPLTEEWFESVLAQRIESDN